MKPRGFTIVEMLIALALMATLLASVAIAVDASFTSYDQNENIAAATQTARAVLGRMVDDIRAADAAQADNANKISIIPPANDQGLTLIVYELSNGTLFLRRTVNAVTTSYPLLAPTDEVTLKSLTFTSTLGKDAQGITCTRSITAHLCLSIGNQQFSVTASASPRRNQTY